MCRRTGSNPDELQQYRATHLAFHWPQSSRRTALDHRQELAWVRQALPPRRLPRRCKPDEIQPRIFQCFRAVSFWRVVLSGCRLGRALLSRRYRCGDSYLRKNLGAVQWRLPDNRLSTLPDRTMKFSVTQFSVLSVHRRYVFNRPRRRTTT